MIEIRTTGLQLYLPVTIGSFRGPKSQLAKATLQLQNTFCLFSLGACSFDDRGPAVDFRVGALTQSFWLKTICIWDDDTPVCKAFDKDWVAQCHTDRFVQTLDLVRRCTFGRIDTVPNGKFKAWHA